MNEPSFKEFVLDQLQNLAGVRCRAMFGGHGLYQSETFFGIIFRGRLFFKTDAKSRAAFETMGMSPFTYEAPSGKKLTMSYHEVPPEVLEDPTNLINWAATAISAAKSAPAQRRLANSQPRPRSVTRSSSKSHS